MTVFGSVAPGPVATIGTAHPAKMRIDGDVFRWDGQKLTPGKPPPPKDVGPETFATAWQ